MTLAFHLWQITSTKHLHTAQAECCPHWSKDQRIVPMRSLLVIDSLIFRLPQKTFTVLQMTALTQSLSSLCFDSSISISSSSSSSSSLVVAWCRMGRSSARQVFCHCWGIDPPDPVFVLYCYLVFLQCICIVFVSTRLTLYWNRNPSPSSPLSSTLLCTLLLLLPLESYIAANAISCQPNCNAQGTETSFLYPHCASPGTDTWILYWVSLCHFVIRRKNVDLHSDEGSFCRFNEIPQIADLSNIHWRILGVVQVDIMESGSATISSQCWDGKYIKKIPDYTNWKHKKAKIWWQNSNNKKCSGWHN